MNNKDEITPIVELGEAEAYADMMMAAPIEWGFRVERMGSALALIAPMLDTPLFNRVMGLGVREPATEDILDAYLGLYEQTGIRNYTVQIAPKAWPVELPGWLAKRGMKPSDNWVKMIRRPEPQALIPTDLRIETIGPEYADAFGQVACLVFGIPAEIGQWFETCVGRPGWRHYLAFDHDQPVASAALFIKNSIGWLGIAGTLPNYRQRGAQGALLSRRILDGLSLGCRWLVTETGEETPDHPNPSYRNMLRVGFQLVYPRPNYMKHG